jgi:hypothetical protein
MFTEQTSERTWNATAGWQRVRVWEGPESELDGFYSSIAPPGYVASRESFRPLGQTSAGDTTVKHWMRVELTYGIQATTGEGSDPGLISRIWSLHPVEDQVEIINSAIAEPLRARSANWPRALLHFAEAWRADLVKKASTEVAIHPSGPTAPYTNPAPPTPPSGATGGEISLANEILNRLVKDPGAHRVENHYVLRKTEVVNSLTALKAVHANVNRQFSYAGLAAAEPTLPTAALIDAPGLAGFTWHKKAPQVEQVGRGLFQIVAEWEGGDGVVGDPLLYGNPITS